MASSPAMAGRPSVNYNQQYGNISAALAAEKKARRLAEEDALRLYSRIRQLEKEDERADKTIKETKQKAASVREQQQRLLERVAEKQAVEAAREAAIERQRIENLKLKQQHERTRQQVEDKLYAERVSLATATKEERAELAAELEQLQMQRLAAAAAKKEAVKQMQAAGEAKVQQHKATKQIVAQQGYESRLQEELEIKASKRKEIAELAQLELQLIERLKLKQQQQLEAAQQLESALACSRNMRSSQSMQSAKSSRRSSRQPSGRSSPAPNGKQHSPQRHQQQLQQQQQQQLEADEAVARAFSKFDAAATGLISTKDLQGLMADLGMPLTNEQLDMAAEQMDSEHTSFISFGQFLLWWRE